MISKKTYEKIVGKGIRYDILFRYVTVNKLIRKYKKGKIKILDVGSGHGFLPFFTDKNCFIYGIDLDEKRVSRATAIKHKNAIFLKGDAENFNINKKFDVILALDVIEHLTYPKRCLKHVSEHLKDDGIFIVSNPNRYSFWTLFFDNRFLRLENHKHYWNVEQFARMAKDFRFKLIETIPRPFFGEAIGWAIKDYRPFLKYDNFWGKMFPEHATGQFLVFKKT